MAKKRISIGMLAWNEASTIERTVRSLFEQTLFSQDVLAGIELEVICVPNGCTDDTAHVAGEVLAACEKAVASEFCVTKVFPVPEPGKANAWNRYVHEFADQRADYVFLMDSDIWFEEPKTMELLLHALEDNPSAHFAIDNPVKDISFKSQRSFAERLSLGAGGGSDSLPNAVCGQLYCSRGGFIRRMWLPVGLTTQDAYLTAMVRTTLLTAEPKNDRLVCARGAWHIFEAYATPRSIFKHNRSIAIGTVVSKIVVQHIKQEMGDGDAGTYVRRMNEEAPGWVENLIRDEFARRKWWIIPGPFSMRRFQRLKDAGFSRGVLRLPSAIAGFLMDFLVNLSANWTVRRTKSTYFWEKARK